MVFVVLFVCVVFFIMRCRFRSFQMAKVLDWHQACIKPRPNDDDDVDDVDDDHDDDDHDNDDDDRPGRHPARVNPAIPEQHSSTCSTLARTQTFVSQRTAHREGLLRQTVAV